MTKDRQFELITMIRAYAQTLLDFDRKDIRPSTAYEYRLLVVKMNDLQKQLDCVS